MTTVHRKIWNSPHGKIYLYADDRYLLAVTFDANDELLQDRLELRDSISGENLILLEAVKQLDEYFRGERKAFDLPLRFEGTDFQRQAWKALLDIPYGETSNYSLQAERMAKRGAVRAVGSANGRNAYSIIVPCHRVVGRDGKLRGYAGGLEMKAALLRLEGVEDIKH